MHMNFKWLNYLLLISFIVIFIELQGSRMPHFCLFEEFFNLHCPFCGVTKSFEEILNQNFIIAFKINFMSYGLIFFFLFKYIFEIFKLDIHTLKLNKIFTFLCLVQFLRSNLILEIF